MDRIIAGLRAFEDGDLMLCPEHGVAYQREMAIRVPYGKDYFNKCLSYENQVIAERINAGRISLVNRHVGEAAAVLDIGIGSGEFIKRRPHTFGYDINPVAIVWLREHDLWVDEFAAFTAFTFWDVIEHVETPEDYFASMADGSFLFTCLPIFSDVGRIRESRHYRPGEHLYYWTEQGFVDWMALHRFRLLERQSFETEAGRDSIVSFAFNRV